ncbi:sulfatase-like hydrolase/transferase [Nevskia soli]|uniref:sulfatase-like hydrolase/transferase n=1 Tax=Nevskia soli TaxID=418856 RepID=UPI0015D78DDC|nr:sulfatase-like hydrolase/transferase [Nevskia soli]
MDSRNQQQPAKFNSARLNRREFLTALGVAAGGMLAAESGLAKNQFPQYQDSFGNVAPAAGDAINVGVYPPPISEAATGPAKVTPGYAQPNILMIMVDQLRSPRWLPPGGQAAIDQLLPNIAFLREHSFNFPNYFVAATDCTPSRATILTGLYSQQTFMFKTQTSNAEPTLQPGFPTFGTALAQQANYTTCWIGKWHLSDYYPKGVTPGASGPGVYGFSAGGLNLPPNSSLASPSGVSNEGTVGYNNAPYGSGTLTPPVTVPSIEAPTIKLLSDGAIANWFIDQWLPAAPLSNPWFAAVSFVNPHDICNFPSSFGLAGTTNFGSASTTPTTGFEPPPTPGYPYVQSQPDDFIPPLNSSLYLPNVKLPTQWNIGDNPMTQPYGVSSANGWGKPGLQAYFESQTNYTNGTIQNVNGWLTFLNYYFWMQSCADYQIGRVLESLGASKFASNTVIVFTSDHGDYGGSHSMHMKGGGLYDESINVPLYISFPQMRPPFAPASTARTRTFVCSSVDIFPFLYTLALGNSSWRNNSADPYTYLSGREAILDAILSSSPAQRRVSTFPNQNGPGSQPYVLHTTDEYPSPTIPGTQTPQPGHAIAYRTVDTTVQTNVGGVTFYGGAKLGIYSYWPCTTTTPDTTKPQQYEFYNYSQGNIGETGNSALVSATQLDVLPSQYLTAYTTLAPDELYVQFPQFAGAAQAAEAAYLAYLGTSC